MVRKYTRSIQKKSYDWSKQLPLADSGLCILCKHAASDDADPTIMRLGRTCTFAQDDKTYVVHRNCLYASPSLGNNDILQPDHIFGFRLKDLMKEANRGKSLNCFFCKKKGAVHGCSEKSCRRSFHLYCAAKCNYLCLFRASHMVYCEQHAKGHLAGTDYERFPTSGASEKDRKALECCLCKENLFENLALADDVGDRVVHVGREHVQKVAAETVNWLALRLACAKGCKEGDAATADYVHRWCLEALSERKGRSGLNCPKCNDHKYFVEYLERNGIFLEVKKNDDEERIRLYEKCTADVCHVNKFGDDEAQNRKYKTDYGECDIGLCRDCGRSLHLKCSVSRDHSRSNSQDFYCHSCLSKWQQQNHSSESLLSHASSSDNVVAATSSSSGRWKRAKKLPYSNSHATSLPVSTASSQNCSQYEKLRSSAQFQSVADDAVSAIISPSSASHTVANMCAVDGGYDLGDDDGRKFRIASASSSTSSFAAGLSVQSIMSTNDSQDCKSFNSATNLNGGSGLPCSANDAVVTQRFGPVTRAAARSLGAQLRDSLPCKHHSSDASSSSVAFSAVVREKRRGRGKSSTFSDAKLLSTVACNLLEPAELPAFSSFSSTTENVSAVQKPDRDAAEEPGWSSTVAVATSSSSCRAAPEAAASSLFCCSLPCSTGTMAAHPPQANALGTSSRRLSVKRNVDQMDSDDIKCDVAEGSHSAPAVGKPIGDDNAVKADVLPDDIDPEEEGDVEFLHVCFKLRDD